MTFRDIFVHLDNTERSRLRAALAIGLARRFGARLNVLFAECDPYLANLASRLPEDMYHEAAEHLQGAMRPQAAAAGVELSWSTSVTRRDSGLTQAVLLGARHSDIAILGQHEPGQQNTGVPADLVEQVTLHAGRPVLAIPFIGEYPTLGSRIMVAWNGGREAVRAVHDALPFLAGAERVVIAAVNPDDAEAAHGEVPLAAIARHLEAHAVTAELETLQVHDVGVMDLLLSRAADHSINLLVMGAHGHYGFPHMQRGAGTRHILGHMTAPVLLSH